MVILTAVMAAFKSNIIVKILSKLNIYVVLGVVILALLYTALSMYTSTKKENQMLKDKSAIDQYVIDGNKQAIEDLTDTNYINATLNVKLDEEDLGGEYVKLLLNYKDTLETLPVQEMPPIPAATSELKNMYRSYTKPSIPSPPKIVKSDDNHSSLAIDTIHAAYALSIRE